MKTLERLIFLTYFQMRSKYRKTLAGFVWVIAYPIISFVIQATVFDKVLKLNIENYPSFLLAGFLPWVFISQCVISYASVLVHSREILLTFKIHPAYIIASSVLDNFVNYLVATIILVISLLLMGMISISLIQLFLFIISALLLLMFVFILTTMIGFLHVFYRDIQFVATFLIGLAFFVTPIFYTREYLDQSYPWVLKINIFYPLIGLFQNCLYKIDLAAWQLNFAHSIIVILFLGTLSLLLFKNKMKDFYINV